MNTVNRKRLSIWHPFITKLLDGDQSELLRRGIKCLALLRLYLRSVFRRG